MAELKKLGELGMLGVTVAPEWGGAGATYRALTMAVEMISSADASIGVVMSTHNSLACMPIFEHGTETQKERFLRPLVSGQMIGAVAITETQAGSNAADIRTRAQRKNGGYVLNGSKQFITAGGYADVVLLMANIDDDLRSAGITCFIVPTDTPGFSVGRIEEKLGIRSSGTAQLILEGVELSDEHVLGMPGKGYRIILSALGRSRIGIAAQAVGIAQAALDAALVYARERQSFGKPIIDHQAVSFRLANMATEIEAARQLTYRAAELCDAGLSFQKESSMAKLFASEMAERVCSQALQTFGGYGYLADFPVERLYRDARISQIYEGTNDIQRMIIGRALNSE
jgi:alkylation response protein AidB-like acyl-CoA dehydrogenase